jgi:hypothetical protein
MYFHELGLAWNHTASTIRLAISNLYFVLQAAPAHGHLAAHLKNMRSSLYP